MLRLSQINKVFLALSIFTAVIFGLNGCAKPGPNQVFIRNYAFNPSTITISPGTTLTWENKDLGDHTSSSDSSVWDSGHISPKSSYTFTFTTPGTYTYHCNIHTSMHGTVIVK
jgi:plastocyanin